MRVRTGFVLKCAVGTLLIGAALVANEAQAQSSGNAPAAPDLWWFHGYLEAGGRMFLNNPQRDGVASEGGKSLAKYYEYSTIKPGAFLDGHVATGSNDGRYQADLWANNVGYSDQRYLADLSKAGEQYLTLGWDQIPHVYSTSARTLYNGTGTGALTLPGGLSNSLFVASGGTNPIAPANAAAVQALINANSHQTDIGIRRDTASAEYRWTPTDAWDLRADFSNMRRTGTQVEGVVFSASTSGVKVDATAPIADTTRNFGLNGEYAGTSFWNKKFNIKLAYGGSTYENDFNSYTVENPFCPAGAVGVVCARGSAPIARMTRDPDNQAHMFSGTLGADLPFKSRYMGTLSYSMMRQNQAFLPFTITPGLLAINGAPSNSTASLPASSLNGAINTVLSNNVVTTQITPDLKSKLSYRYYDYDNQTPERLFSDYITTDAVSSLGIGFAPARSTSISYTRQNAGADLNWRPSRQWNVGVAYGYERYNWTRADVGATTEHSGKIYGDWKPTSWVTARASWLHSARRYDNYDNYNNVGHIMWPDEPIVAGLIQNPAYRQFMFSNRDRDQAKFSLAVDVAPRVTVTPTAGLQYDNYLNKVNLGSLTTTCAGANCVGAGTYNGVPLNGSEPGLKKNNAWNWGAEVSVVANPSTTIMLAYLREYRDQEIIYCGNSAPAAVPPPAGFCSNFSTSTGFPSGSNDANLKDTVNTFMARLRHEVIPNKFDLDFGYTLSIENSSKALNPGPFPSLSGGAVTITSFPFPDNKTTFQRFDAMARYKLDQDVVQRSGIRGEVTAKLRYAYERSRVTNWQYDTLHNYMYSANNITLGYMTWLAGNNPNFDAHLIAAALAVKW